MTMTFCAQANATSWRKSWCRSWCSSCSRLWPWSRWPSECSAWRRGTRSNCPSSRSSSPSDWPSSSWWRKPPNLHHHWPPTTPASTAHRRPTTPGASRTTLTNWPTDPTKSDRLVPLLLQCHFARFAPHTRLIFDPRFAANI